MSKVTADDRCCPGPQLQWKYLFVIIHTQNQNAASARVSIGFISLFLPNIVKMTMDTLNIYNYNTNTTTYKTLKCAHKTSSLHVKKPILGNRIFIIIVSEVNEM